MTLVNVLSGIGLLFLVLGLFLQGYIGDTAKLTLVTLCFFFVGLSGLIIIIKKEVSYTILSFDGFPAVLIGIVASIAGFITSALFFIGILRSLAK
jgi:hypothetical protein